MARWIFEFRSSGVRPLTPEEQVLLARQIRGLLGKRVVWALLAILSGFLAFVMISVAAGGEKWGWAGLVGFVGLTFWLGLRGSGAEMLEQLYRRTLRVGTVEKFDRVPGDETVQRKWRTPRSNYDDEDEEDRILFLKHGEEEEQFEKSLAAIAGATPDSFESVEKDGLVLWVGGKLVKEVIDPPVWDVLDSES